MAERASQKADAAWDLVEIPAAGTPGGVLVVVAVAAGGALVELGLFRSRAAALDAVPAGAERRPWDPALPEARTQLAEYLAGERRRFNLPLAPRGTEFERRVWRALTDIPYGETRSYAEIAGIIGSPSACRAVGRANGRNPIAIVIPCHRVIGSDGSLTGYGGGLDLKRFLLDLEGAGAQRAGAPSRTPSRRPARRRRTPPQLDLPL